MGRAAGPRSWHCLAFPSSEPEWVSDTLPPKLEVLSPKPWEGAHCHEHSTGGTLPSASASSWGGRGSVHPAAGARMLISIPWSGGLRPGAPTQIFCPWLFYIGLPASPGACDQCTPVPPLWKNAPTAPLLASAGGSQASLREESLPAGVSSKTEERENSGNLGDCSNRERSMNISLRWLKLLNSITKPNVLAGI